MTNKSDIKLFDSRNEMIVYYSNTIKYPKILEIGIFRGDFFNFIFNNCNPQKLDGVDIFSGITCSGDENGNNVINYDIGLSFIELIEKYKNYSNIKLHKSDSVSYLNSVEDEYYDIIYIDGDHSYNGVKRDLEVAFKKIKNKGFIMGHDYEMNYAKALNHYQFGVEKAVDEFCDNYNQKIIAKGLDGCVSFCIQINK